MIFMYRNIQLGYRKIIFVWRIFIFMYRNVFFLWRIVRFKCRKMILMQRNIMLMLRKTIFWWCIIRLMCRKIYFSLFDSFFGFPEADLSWIIVIFKPGIFIIIWNYFSFCGLIFVTFPCDLDLNSINSFYWFCKCVSPPDSLFCSVRSLSGDG